MARSRRLPHVHRPAGTALAGAVLALLMLPSAGASASASGAAAPSSAPRLIVGFEDGVSDRRAVQATDAADTDVVRRLRGADATVVVVEAGQTPAQAERELEASPAVAYAEPDQRLQATRVPDDTRFGELWGLSNLGIDGRVADADIDAPEAWDLLTGATAPVAVLDSGIDVTHPDLDGNLWRAAGEIAGNGVDDDGDGYVDDVIGYDFLRRDGTPEDENHHGTHVSGTVAAEGDNGLGVTGVQWTGHVMALKFLDVNGTGYTSDAVDAIGFAVHHGVRVINASWGGAAYSQALHDAIAAAGRSGAIVVAAAGNDGVDSDTVPRYPAAYMGDNVISVAASTDRDQLATFSDYGACSVDLAAPGVDILSTVPGGYATYSGTSMAAPHVAAVAALMLSRNPSLTVAQLRDRLLGSVDRRPALGGRILTGGRLNAHAAVEAAAGSAPPAGPTGGSCAAAPVSTSPPTVTGLAQEGQILNALPGGWTQSPTTFAYRWERCDAGGACETTAAGASAGYVVSAADVGYRMRVAVMAGGLSGSGSATSPMTAVVVARALPPRDPDASAPAMTLRLAAAQAVLRSGAVAFRVGCPTEGCAVSVRARFTGVRAVTRLRPITMSRSIAAGGSWSARVRLSAAHRFMIRRELARRRTIRVQLRITVRDAAGNLGIPAVRTVRLTR